MSSYHQYKKNGCEPAKNPEVFEFNAVIIKQLKIAAIPSKLKILFLLKKSHCCVCDLTAHTKLSQTLISHHLSGFAKAGLVRSKKSGAFVDYFLTDKGHKLLNVIKKLNS